MLTSPIRRMTVVMLFSLPIIVSPSWALPNLERESSIGGDLTYRLQGEWYRSFKDISNQLFNPVGFEPKNRYPVMLLLSTCGGIRSVNHSQMHFWVRESVRAGYLTLVIDSVNSRGLKHNCGRDRTVEDGRLMRDVLDAVASLNKLPFVDSNRIFSIGFSQGAMTNFLLSSQSARSEIGNPKGVVRALAGLYGFCSAGESTQYRWLRGDTDTPLLVLGGENDTEAPFADCVSVIRSVNERRSLIQFHIYPGLSHAWDSEGLNNFSKIAPNGNTVRYLFDENARRDSKDRIFRFFDSFK